MGTTRRQWPIAALAAAMLLTVATHGLTFMATYNTAANAALWVHHPVPALPQASDDRDAVLFVVDGLVADGVPLLRLPDAELKAAAPCELVTVYPSFSRPAHVAMLTGAPPILTGIHTNRHRGPATVETLADLGRAAGRELHVVTDGIDWWDPLFGPWTTSHFGRQGFDAALEALIVSARRPSGGGGRLFLVHLVAGDDAGHEHGAASAEYAHAMGRVGERLSHLVAELSGSVRVLMVSDHGHMPRGGHGGPEPEVRRTPMLAWGPGVGPTPADCHQRTVDVAPTLAGWLGLPIPAANTGHPIEGLASARTRARVDQQHVRLARILGAPPGVSLGSVLPRVRPPNHLGALAAALAWALGVLGLFRGVMRRWPQLRELLSGSLFAAVFTLIYGLAEPALSFSAVWVQREWFARMLLLAILAVTIATALRRLLRWQLPRGADERGEHILALGASGALVFTAWGLHGSLSGGPELGDPQSAFAMLVGDFLVGVTALASLMTLAGRRLLRR